MGHHSFLWTPVSKTQKITWCSVFMQHLLSRKLNNLISTDIKASSRRHSYVLGAWRKLGISTACLETRYRNPNVRPTNSSDLIYVVLFWNSVLCHRRITLVTKIIFFIPARCQSCFVSHGFTTASSLLHSTNVLFKAFIVITVGAFAQNSTFFSAATSPFMVKCYSWHSFPFIASLMFIINVMPPE